MIALPKLRLVDIHPLEHEGSLYYYLRDPYMLSGRTLLVPQPLAPLLALCDGAHDVPGLRAALAEKYQIRASLSEVQSVIDRLDAEFLLENETYTHARREVEEQFRAQPRRPLSSLSRQPGATFAPLLESMRAALHSTQNHGSPHAYRGMISPHIDYERGMNVYAKSWSAAAASAQSARRAFIFGTDHFSEGLPLSLTRLSYQTPLGELPTAVGVVDRLADQLGAEVVFQGELHHRFEHSIELAAAWLHLVRDGQPIELVPILAGPLEPWLASVDGAPTLFEQALSILSAAFTETPSIVIAAGDLSHVGPAFGGLPHPAAALPALAQTDQALLSPVFQGDSAAFLEHIRATQDATNVCGVSPIAWMLRLLDGAAGQQIAYDQCPADTQYTSWVSICGAVFA